MSTSSPTAPKFQLPQMPDGRAAEKITTAIIKQSADLVIKDEDGWHASWSLVGRHDEAIGKIEQMFGPFVDGLHKLHKMAVQLRGNFLNPVMESKKRLLTERMRYSNEQERIAREARRIEAERLQKEQAKQLEADARKLQKKDPETAAVLREQAANVPLPRLPSGPAVPKQAGSVVTERWCFEITEPHLVPRELCDPTPSRIRKNIESTDGSTEIPGVIMWRDKSESSRAVR